MTMAPTQHLFPNMSALNPIDMKMNGSCGGSGGGEKQLKTEYKPEQLASLLQAAASQPVPVWSCFKEELRINKLKNN
jgi:hypothetical protein